MADKTPWTKLRKAREAAGLTRDELSARSGVGVQQIYRLESGDTTRARAGAESVAILADALGTTVEDLMSDDTVDAVQQFISRLERLSMRDLNILRREAGQQMRDARTADAYRVFYSSLPVGALPTDDDGETDPELTEIWYNVACMAAAVIYSRRGDDNRDAIPLAEAIGRIAGMNEADYYKQRVINAVDTRWTTDGYTVSLVNKLVRLALMEGYNIDCEALLRDALQWNSPDQSSGWCWADAYIKGYNSTAKKSGRRS